MEQENYDYDFTLYDEDEQDKESVIESMSKYERPKIMGLRARFSNGQATLDRLALLMQHCSELGIKIGSYTDNKSELWEYYGTLGEIWRLIRNMFGKVINDEIITIQKRCRLMLLAYADNDVIPMKVHNNLLYWCDGLYRLAQKVNLSFEVEKISSQSSRAKRMIVE